MMIGFLILNDAPDWSLPVVTVVNPEMPCETIGLILWIKLGTAAFGNSSTGVALRTFFLFMKRCNNNKCHVMIRIQFQASIGQQQPWRLK